MKYVCLVYGEEQKLHDLTPEGLAELDASALAYDRSLEASSHLIIAQALQSVKTAKSIRRRGGRRLVTDGPFAETKEQLLGFLMVEAKDLRRGPDHGRRLSIGGTRHDRGEGGL